MNVMSTHNRRALALATALALSPASSFAFDSGSTGADGAFSPQVDTELQLPPDGIFNFTTVNIPEGVTVTFKRNVTNTPVVMLASGDVTIAGTIDVSGTPSPPVGTAGDGNLGDDGTPGLGGPGGFDGGRGGMPGDSEADRLGSPGLGPGGGAPARSGDGDVGSGGGGAGFNGRGGDANYYNYGGGDGGSAYGTDTLLPLIGGSGGGGAFAGVNYGGSGGGGGGGAILIASSGTFELTGLIRSRGRGSGAADGLRVGGSGGSGSGGAVRVIATNIEGDGTIDTRAYSAGSTRYRGGTGAQGRVRFEADFSNFGGSTYPSYAFGQPGEIFVAGMPTLRIASVAGTDAPAAPTGSADIVLPEDTPNPVTVTFQTAGIPLGNTVALKVVPSFGAAVEVVSNALSGAETNATAEVEVDIPDGPSVLQASVSFTVVDGSALSGNLARFTGGEQVATVTVDAGMDGSGTTKLVTVSGRELLLPSNVVAMQ